MDAEKLEQMILSNQNLVYFAINKWFPSFRDDDDIIQTGMIGLWKACESYDENKGHFSTYAIPCIVNAIRHELRKQTAGCRSGETISYEVYIQSEKDCAAVADDYSNVEYDMSFLKRQFNQRDYTAFLLYIDGASCADIGRQFNLSRQRVSSIIKNCRQACKSELYC